MWDQKGTNFQQLTEREWDKRNLPILIEEVWHLFIKDREALKMNMAADVMKIKMQISKIFFSSQFGFKWWIPKWIQIAKGRKLYLTSSPVTCCMAAANFSFKRPSPPCWYQNKGNIKILTTTTSLPSRCIHVLDTNTNKKKKKIIEDQWITALIRSTTNTAPYFFLKSRKCRSAIRGWKQYNNNQSKL